MEGTRNSNINTSVWRFSPGWWIGDTGCMFDVISSDRIVFVSKCFLKCWCLLNNSSFAVFESSSRCFLCWFRFDNELTQALEEADNEREQKDKAFQENATLGTEIYTLRRNLQVCLCLSLFMFIPKTNNDPVSNVTDGQFALETAIISVFECGGKNNNVSKQIESVMMIEYQWPSFIKLTREKST